MTNNGESMYGLFYIIYDVDPVTHVQQKYTYINQEVFNYTEYRYTPSNIK